jgi:mannose-1-phosphate guanylyltransferase
VKLEEELNKYSKEAIIQAVVNSGMFMLRGKEILEEVMTKEMDLLYKKQEELLMVKDESVKSNMSAKEALKVLEQREVRYKKYMNLSKQIKKLEDKLYGKYS